MKLKCIYIFLVIFITVSVATSNSDDERNEFASFLIQYLYKNYPNIIPRLLQRYSRPNYDTSLRNQTYRGYVLEMKKEYGYELLLADTYKQRYKYHVFESGRRPLTALYKCESPIRYCSGNPTYCELREGHPESNIILICPHGGKLQPKFIPNRDAGCFIKNECVFSHTCENSQKGIKKNSTACPIDNINDIYTLDITLDVARRIKKLTGKMPHVVINNLHRNKLDVNRDLGAGTFHVPEAVQSWQDFQQLIDIAKSNFNGHMGLILDIHGNSREEGWNMFGYGLSSYYLNRDIIYPNSTTIDSLGKHVQVPFVELLLGNNSLAHFMSQNGVEVMPSINNKKPEDKPYFSGGYIIKRHGSQNKGLIDAIQVEIHEEYRNSEQCSIFAKALAKSIVQFMELNYANKGVIETNQSNYTYGKSNMSESLTYVKDIELSHFLDNTKSTNATKTNDLV